MCLNSYELNEYNLINNGTDMKSNFTVKQVLKKINIGKPLSLTIASNLILDVIEPGLASFHFRYQLNGKRKVKKIGIYGEDNPALFSVENALEEAIEMKRLINSDVDPVSNLSRTNIKTVDDLFTAFFSLTSCEYITEKRIYQKDIKPLIGDVNTIFLTDYHLKLVLKKIMESERPSIAKKALYLFRSVFTDAFEGKILDQNIARNLSEVRHAGGNATPAGVALAFFEIERFYQIARGYPALFHESTLIAITLLLIFGSRKMELLSAQWSDIDWEQKIISIWVDSSKNDLAIAIPIPDSVLPIFQRLQVLSNGSNYLFPARIKGNSPYISDSTINSAINKLFGKVGKSKQYTENVLGKAGVPKFTVHDLRRSFRTLIAELGVIKEVGEACLNHKPKGIVKIYNRFKYLKPRKFAHDKMAKIILPLAGFKYHDSTIFSKSRNFNNNSIKNHTTEFTYQSWFDNNVA